MRDCKTFKWTLFVTMILMSPQVRGQDKTRDKTKAIMDSIYTSMAQLLPLSFNTAKFRAGDNRETIERNLENVAKNADALEHHVQTGTYSGIRHLARSLERDADQAHHFYKLHMYDEAKFVLHRITENCVACHTKVGSKAPGFKIPTFLDQVQKAGLGPLDLAHYQLVGRDFNAALDTYEREFTTSKSTYIATTLFADYFKVAIRVNKDLPRVRTALGKIDLSKLSKSQKKTVEEWQAAAKYIDEKQLIERGDLAAAEEVMALGQGKRAYGRDPSSLVYDVTTSSILNKFVAGEPKDRAGLSKAFYLLGVTEQEISDSFWLSEMDDYLESAVRADPKGPWANRAYTMLEQQYVLGYSGSAGTNIPDDVTVLLKELRSLMEGATTSLDFKVQRQ